MSTFYSLSLQCGSLTGSGRSGSRASDRVRGGNWEDGVIGCLTETTTCVVAKPLVYLKALQFCSGTAYL